mmetsp:Transcript_24128/g.66861  ORF Transcript_24128/g.66861 Transcript_24128/m.66861 type:complete len:311 (+) Transcript_24128:201-1133(+)|eukprot:CAMPEP_0168740078 /NCGR_PEP_ID=MMETSP0724-20121128/11792_1 /TAXON_ID=265536 /ORGANISM="Amphiprora sp., Strain CCMP467" /LENGTH=310 /DNA_ID=CAMNT_0008787499 /DNA_START=132 /DNA_END=1064 /DNA_ORIENTATION=+
MTSSFRYPSQLLHSYTEPQWLPPTHDQQSSSLDRLEAEEQAQIQRIKALVLPENIPDPIGMDDSKKFALNAQQSAAASAEADAALLGPSTSALVQQPSFWERHQAEIFGTPSTSNNQEEEGHNNNNERQSTLEASMVARKTPGSAYRDRSLAPTPITMSAYKRSTRSTSTGSVGSTNSSRSSTSLKRMASGSHGSTTSSSQRRAPSPRTERNPLFGGSSDSTSSERFDFGTAATTTPAPASATTTTTTGAATPSSSSSSFLAAGDTNNNNTSNNSSSMMSLSHDDDEGDTTFDRTYDDDDEDDDDDMDEE